MLVFVGDRPVGFCRPPVSIGPMTTTNASELVDLTCRLVEIPSHEDETATGDMLESWLREETMATVTRDEHGNVLARRGSGEGTIAFVGHHDVVPPDDSQVDNGEYAVDRRAGRLYGRGTADMKGAVAAMCLAFRDARLGRDSAGFSNSDLGNEPPGELVFASFVGEEVGGVGARAAIEDGFLPTYAVVGEGSTGYSAPGVTDVAVAHKGRRAVTVEATGAAAHASEPAAGENAIYRAADAIDVIRGQSFPETTVLDHDVRGSIAVTEIEGGSAWNVIPETCTVTVDERTVPDERAPLDELEAIPGVTWSVDQDLPPMACRDEAFADAILTCARDVTREESERVDEPAAVIKPHATDAGWLAAAGSTCVICGPAAPGEAHTATESVSIAVLQRCYRIYREVADRLVWPG